ncbi:Gfo/Idh/MocA family protein [Micromonospora sp. PTRAS2]
MTAEPAVLGVGVLSAAAIARRRTLPAIATCPQLRLRAVASRDASRAAALAGPYDATPLGDYDQLLRHPGVDAVYLPLPAGLRAPWVRRALSAGKHVLAEKPLTTSAAQTADLVRLARERGLVLMENFAFLHHRRQQTVRELLAGGAIGELRTFTAAFGIPRLPADDIRYQPRLGGGALLDVGVYPLRAAAHFLSGPLSVLAAARWGAPGLRVDAGGHVLLRDVAGVTAELSYGLDHAYRADYTFWGSAGTLSVARAYAAPPDLPTTVVVQRGTGTSVHDIGPDDQFAVMLRAFAAAVHDPLARAQQYRHAVDQAELVDRTAAASDPGR